MGGCSSRIYDIYYSLILHYDRLWIVIGLSPLLAFFLTFFIFLTITSCHISLNELNLLFTWVSLSADEVCYKISPVIRGQRQDCDLFYVLGLLIMMPLTCILRNVKFFVSLTHSAAAITECVQQSRDLIENEVRQSQGSCNISQCLVTV